MEARSQLRHRPTDFKFTRFAAFRKPRAQASWAARRRPSSFPLAPVSLAPVVSTRSSNPTTLDPVRSRPWRRNILARNPHVAYAVPTMVSATPCPAPLRRQRTAFKHRPGRTYTNIYLCSCQSGRNCSPNQCSCCKNLPKTCHCSYSLRIARSDFVGVDTSHPRRLRHGPRNFWYRLRRDQAQTSFSGR